MNSCNKEWSFRQKAGTLRNTQAGEKPLKVHLVLRERAECRQKLGIVLKDYTGIKIDYRPAPAHAGCEPEEMSTGIWIEARDRKTVRERVLYSVYRGLHKSFT
jgi:hypothetical protein